MSSERLVSVKRRISATAGFGSLKSFKVPKKSLDKSLLEQLDTESSDFVDEVLYQIHQSCRFPHLTSYLQIEQAWLVNNRKLEESFNAARKRFQKSGANASSDSNLGVGFYAVFDWSSVENIAQSGIFPGNDQNTWLGKPQQGVVVNQCADLTVARAQNKLITRTGVSTAATITTTSNDSDGSQPVYLVLLRWIKSRAYVVSSEAENSNEPLEPQPGYACHVSTWSRIDPLDPSKLSLERAFQMAQVYLYEFDDELELRPKPEHILPYAVVRCRWTLDSTVCATASGETLTAANGAILVLTAKPLRISLNSRHALLPTPPKSIHRSRSLREEDNQLNRPLSRLINRLTENIPPLIPPEELQTLKNRSHSHSTVIRSAVQPCSPPQQVISTQVDKSISVKITPMHVAILQARRLIAQPDWIDRVGESFLPGVTDPNPSPSAVSFSGHKMVLVGTGFITWGQPGSDLFSLQIELYVYRRPCLPVFDGLFQPCFQVSRLVPQVSLHYELAGLTPWASKTLESCGPPVLVSVPRDQEWCLPRLNEGTATSLQCNPSPFAGYRGNYIRISLPARGRRAEMSQFCDALREKSMAAVIHIPCDESCILFLFPDCQFARSISFPPGDGLDTNYLHGILLTPFSLDRYPYGRVVCSTLHTKTISETPESHSAAGHEVKEPDGRKKFIQATPVSAVSDLLPFGKRISLSIPTAENKMKIPLDALLSALPDEGKELLGTAFIAILASQRGTDGTESCVAQSPVSHVSPQTPIATTNAVPRMDPRLRTARAMDAQPLSSYVGPNVLTPHHPIPVSTTNEPTVDQPAASVTGNSETVVVESQDLVIAEGSSPPAPSSPPREPDVLELECNEPPVEPKEIPLENGLPPLSCSSPTTKDERSFVPCVVTMDSLDMDVESQGNRSRDIMNQSLSNSSDMEVEVPSSRYQSPFKIRYQPYSPNSPKTLPRLSGPFNDAQDNPLEYRHRFSEPAPPSRWGSPRNPIDWVGSRSPTSRCGFPRRTLFGAKPGSILNRHSERDPSRVTRGKQESEFFAVPEQSPHGVSPLQPVHHFTSPSQNASPNHKAGAVVSTDLDQRARFQINASPRLVLEDVAKTHPYYFQSVERSLPVDESEEGEIVDDDNEMDESEDGATASTNAASDGRNVSKGHPRDGYYSSFSSDFSSNTSVNVADEWHNFLPGNSSSRSCSSSSRSSPHGRSGEQLRRRVNQHGVEPVRITDGHADSKHHRWTSRADSEYSPSYNSVAKRRSSFDPTYSSGSSFYRPESTRVPPKSPLDPQFIGTEATSVSADNSDQSVWDTETSLEDEDMRILPSAVSRSSHRLFTSSTQASRNTLNDLCQAQISENKDHSSRAQVFSNKDVDYRRLPLEMPVSSPRHSHRDYSGSRLSAPKRDLIDAADSRPRYSVYHPRSTDLDRSDSGKESSSRSKSDTVPDRREPSTSSESGTFVAHHRSSVSRDNRRYARTERPRLRTGHTSDSKNEVQHSDPRRRSGASVRRDTQLLPAPIPTLLNTGGLLPLSTPPVLPFSGTFLPATLWPFSQAFNPSGSQPPQIWK
ncbi:hypothetical protein FGIG_06074 [Fasciola gigantica]|uniref:TASOR pseudo-PARP domain-containing protein n=1 Tax=Fasciola gigantica TaxID=46835 RepID=A0A504YMC2_FASGI|nr:hypothetical protein FGIG_06074 [Fasciola gigantica]